LIGRDLRATSGEALFYRVKPVTDSSLEIWVIKRLSVTQQYMLEGFPRLNSSSTVLAHILIRPQMGCAVRVVISGKQSGRYTSFQLYPPVVPISHGT